MSNPFIQQFLDDPKAMDNIDAIRTMFLNPEVNPVEFLHLLTTTRHKNKPADHKHDNEIVIAGRYMIDKFGQFSLITMREGMTYEPREPHVPRNNGLFLVTSGEEFKHRHTVYEITWSMMNHYRVPQHDSICPCCGKGWDLLTLSDVHCISEQIDYDPTVHGVGDEIADKVKQLQHGLFVNEHLHHYTYVENDETIVVLYKETYYHKACYAQKKTNAFRKDVITAFKQADFGLIGMVSCPNEYGSELYQGRWLLAETEWGFIKLGWRKRVINIDYSDITKQYDPQTTETKWKSGEHVWNLEHLTLALYEFKKWITEQKLSPRFGDLQNALKK